MTTQPFNEFSLASAAPVAIGGIGGSGTRVVAEVLRDLGYFIGGDLNDALDNMWFTLLFKYREVLALEALEFSDLYRLFRNRMTLGGVSDVPASLRERLLGRERAGLHDVEWLAARYDSLLQVSPVRAPGPWAWKEPNTHMVVNRLVELEPQIRYVHVARNGLDMAYSSNQNQLRLWGGDALSEHFEDTPRGSLAFWRWAHERIIATGSTLGERFHFLRFDDLCADPESELSRLTQFLQIKVPGEAMQALCARVQAPASLRRHRQAWHGGFRPDDVEYVRALGFHLD